MQVPFFGEFLPINYPLRLDDGWVRKVVYQMSTNREDEGLAYELVPVPIETRIVVERRKRLARSVLSIDDNAITFNNPNPAKETEMRETWMANVPADVLALLSAGYERSVEATITLAQDADLSEQDIPKAALGTPHSVPYLGDFKPVKRYIVIHRYPVPVVFRRLTNEQEELLISRLLLYPHEARLVIEERLRAAWSVVSVLGTVVGFGEDNEEMELMAREEWAADMPSILVRILNRAYDDVLDLPRKLLAQMEADPFFGRGHIQTGTLSALRTVGQANPSILGSGPSSPTTPVKTTKSASEKPSKPRSSRRTSQPSPATT